MSLGKLLCIFAIIFLILLPIFPPIKKEYVLRKFNLSNADFVFDCEQDKDNPILNFSRYGLINNIGVCCFFAINETNTFYWVGFSYIINKSIVEKRFYLEDEHMERYEKFYYPLKMSDWSKFKDHPVHVWCEEKFVRIYE